MARWLIIVFIALTLGSGWMTWNNVGMQQTTFTKQQSVRSGSSGSYYGGGYSGGGYRTGK